MALGVKIRVKAHLDSRFLEMIDTWPAGFFDRFESTFVASELDTFTGFVKIAITERTLPIDEGRRIADFILVVVFNLGGFFAYILDGEHATKFETFAKSILNLDRTTAEAELEKFRHATSKHSRSGITATDCSTNRSFRVSAKRRTKEWHAKGWHLRRRAFKVGLFL